MSFSDRYAQVRAEVRYCLRREVVQKIGVVVVRHVVEVHQPADDIVLQSRLFDSAAAEH